MNLSFLRHLTAWDWVRIVLYIAGIVCMPQLQKAVLAMLPQGFTLPDLTPWLQGALGLKLAGDKAVPQAVAMAKGVVG